MRVQEVSSVSRGHLPLYSIPVPKQSTTPLSFRQDIENEHGTCLQTDQSDGLRRNRSDIVRPYRSFDRNWSTNSCIPSLGDRIWQFCSERMCRSSVSPSSRLIKYVLQKEQFKTQEAAPTQRCIVYIPTHLHAILSTTETQLAEHRQSP